MSAPAPLRHYFAGPNRTCAHGNCGRPASDPLHLTPGDDTAWTEAVKASTAGHTSRDPGPASREHAEKRNAARWTFGTAGRSTPPRAG